MKYIDKFYSYRWGVFNHFLYVLQNNPNLPNSRGRVTSWDELVNEFDAKALARQLNEIGAKYYVITVRRRHIFYALLARLIAELAQAGARLGLHMTPST